jgi:ribonuclease-3
MFEDFYTTIQYTFQQPALLETAFTHSSYAHEKGLSASDYNERLEFLGDAVLELTISDVLYQRFPSFTEGQLTKFRAGLVCEPTLAKLAAKMNVAPFLRLGKGEEATGGRQRDALAADAFEAMLGAVYLDAGIEKARAIIVTWFEPEILHLRDRFEFNDHKTFLQEALQKNSKEPVNYQITQEDGPDHDKTFTADVLLAGKILGTGSGKSKKEAEQAAAHAALQKLKLSTRELT